MVQSGWSPLPINGNYAQELREILLFEGVISGPHPNYLTATDLRALFPHGLIDRSSFSFRGSTFRLSRARDPATDRAVYLALEAEDPPPDSRPPSRTLFSSPSFPSAKADMHRTPLQSFSPWSNGFDSEQESPHAHGASPNNQMDFPARAPPQAGGPQQPFASAPSYNVTTPSYSGYAPRDPTPPPLMRLPSYSAPVDHSHKFAQDMIVATSSQVPLERYKALVALMSILRREMQAVGVADVAHPECWEAAAALPLLKSIVLVGECLAKFGSADFNEGSNSVRAITTKDYATLLRQYLQTYGFIYQQDFISAISDVALQDDIMTVCNLLQTRCEANDLLFGQLIKHVGLEGGQRGGATVYNSTTVTANPNNSVTCNPTTTTSSTSSAQARLKSLTSGMGPAAIAVAGLGMLLLTKGRLFGRGNDRGGKEQTGGRGGGRKGGGHGWGRLMENERLMVSTLAACQQELDRSRQNTELLENDWRLGRLRLASPANPLPPGYKEVDSNKCDLQQFYRALRDEALMHELHAARAD